MPPLPCPIGISNENYFYRYTTTPVVWYGTYNNLFSDSDFAGYVQHARNQWSNAGLNTTATTNQTSSNLQVYGGSWQTMKLINDKLGLFEPGHTWRNSYGSINFKVNGVGDIYGYATSLSKIVIVHVDGRTDNNYKNVATHEMGHCFGWEGHSPNSTDIMHSAMKSSNILQNRDKLHVTQVYDLYPY